jgi:hypothetical protein
MHSVFLRHKAEMYASREGENVLAADFTDDRCAFPLPVLAHTPRKRLRIDARRWSLWRLTGCGCCMLHGSAIAYTDRLSSQPWAEDVAEA